MDVQTLTPLTLLLAWRDVTQRATPAQMVTRALGPRRWITRTRPAVAALEAALNARLPTAVQVRGGLVQATHGWTLAATRQALHRAIDQLDTETIRRLAKDHQWWTA